MPRKIKVKFSQPHTGHKKWNEDSSLKIRKAQTRNAKIKSHNTNPYDANDYEEQETAWRKTLAGTVLDKKMEFVVGGGVKPVFELKNTENVDEEAEKKALEKYDKLKGKLEAIDKDKGITFKQKLISAAVSAKVYGRCVLAFDPTTEEKKQDKDGVEEPVFVQPTTLKIIHAQDLGEPDIDEKTGEVIGVALSHGDAGIIEEHQMIYFENNRDNPIHGSIGYGYSEMDRIIGSSKALRRLIEFDAPEIAESMWAGYGMFLVDTEGLSESDAKARLNTLLDSLKPGAFNAITAKKDQIEFIPINLEAKVSEIVNLVDMYERLTVGNFGVPSPLIGREEESNMATLFGKIRLFINGPVQADREWLGTIIAEQWYKRLIGLIDPEALDVINVKAEFEPIVIEEWADMINALNVLKVTIPTFPDEALLRLAGLDEFKGDLEDNATTVEKVNQLKQVEKDSFFREAKEYLNKAKAKKRIL